MGSMDSNSLNNLFANVLQVAEAETTNQTQQQQADAVAADRTADQTVSRAAQGEGQAVGTGHCQERGTPRPHVLDGDPGVFKRF